MKRGKKYVDGCVKTYDRDSYSMRRADAIALVKKTQQQSLTRPSKLHISTGCDGRHAEQQIRGAVVLPHGTGKTVRVLVFAKGDKGR